MNTLAIVSCCILAALALYQSVIVLIFTGLFYRRPRTSPVDQELPKAAILLPLRGADPELADALRRLMQQDYPDYELQIVVDHQEDPAREVARQAVRELGATHVSIDVLNRKSNRCSPQCSALIQAAENVDDSSELIVVVDGDVMTHPTWLRELVSPLLDPGVGIAHGNRWFMPRDGRWGSLVRYLWNAGAVVPMWMFGIPWAGSFAIRKSVLHESGLFGMWPKSIVPDAPALKLLEKLKLEIRFVPTLMMVNREICDLAFALDFLKRQMTWTRTYHPHWWPVLLHALVSAGVVVFPLVLFSYGLAAGRYGVAAWAGGGVGGFFLSMAALLMIAERGVRHVVRARGEETSWLSPVTLVKLLPAIPLALCVHLAAVLLATFRRTVAWRGVVYKISAPYDIRIMEDRPYDDPDATTSSNVSL